MLRTVVFLYSSDGLADLHETLTAKRSYKVGILHHNHNMVIHEKKVFKKLLTTTVEDRHQVLALAHLAIQTS